MVKDALYLLLGKEAFLKKEFIRDIRSKISPEASSDDLEYLEFFCSESPLAALEDFFANASLFSSKKMAVLWETDELESEERERLVLLCRNISSGVLAVCSEEANAKKSPFLNQLSSIAHTHTFHVPFDRDFPAFVQARARKRGCTLDSESVFFLLQETGKDASAIDAALEKLSIYAHPRKTVTLADAQALLGRSVQADVFSLVEKILSKNAKASISTIQDLLRDGGRGHEIMGVLASQFERLKKASRLIERGLSDAEVGAELKVHPYYLGKTLSQAKSLSKARMREVFQELSSCDEAIKTGKLSEALALEKLALALCLA